MRTLTALALLLAGPALAAPEEVLTLSDATDRLLVQERDVITLESARAADRAPGERVAVYVAEARPDPRTDGMTEGLRYAGDARVVWVGSDLVQLELTWPDQTLAVGADAVLGAPRSASPTPSWSPSKPSKAPSSAPEPADTPEPGDEPDAEMPTPEGGSADPVTEDPPVEARAVEAEAPPEAAPDTALHLAQPDPEGGESEAGVGVEADPQTLHLAQPDPERVGALWRERYGTSQALTSSVDWADDGFGTGVGLGSLGWAWVPEKGAGRVSVRLEGVRGSRWVAAEGGGRREPEAREPAVGYWLWTGLEGSSPVLAPRVGLAVGVQQSGPTAGLELGLRSGLPHSGHVTLDYAVYGALGTRWTLTGAVPLSDRVRVGPRARIGALPEHQPPDVGSLPVEGPNSPWRQQRADGSVRASWDLSDHLTATGGAGLSAYDLVFADSGPVFDLALELRW